MRSPCYVLGRRVIRRTVLAQQGYVVVAINPAGSTTFGQGKMLRYMGSYIITDSVMSDFTDAISGDWGGRPFEDLRKGWAHIKHHWPQVDFNRAVAAGASWGGYAIKCVRLYLCLCSLLTLFLKAGSQVTQSGSSNSRLCSATTVSSIRFTWATRLRSSTSCVISHFCYRLPR